MLRHTHHSFEISGWGGGDRSSGLNSTFRLAHHSCTPKSPTHPHLSVSSDFLNISIGRNSSPFSCRRTLRAWGTSCLRAPTPRTCTWTSSRGLYRGARDLYRGGTGAHLTGVTPRDQDMVRDMTHTCRAQQRRRRPRCSISGRRTAAEQPRAGIHSEAALMPSMSLVPAHRATCMRSCTTGAHCSTGMPTPSTTQSELLLLRRRRGQRPPPDWQTATGCPGAGCILESQLKTDITVLIRPRTPTQTVTNLESRAGEHGSRRCAAWSCSCWWSSSSTARCSRSPCASF